MRRLLTAVFLVALLGVAAPAASQEESVEQPPTELWEEYPLETAPSAPPEGGEKPPTRDESPPPAAEPRPGASEDDGALGTFAILAIALLAVAASAAVVRLGIAARRRRTTPAIGPTRRERPAHRPRPVPAVAGAPPTRPQRRPANVRERRRSAPAAPDSDAPEPPAPKRRRAAPAPAQPTLAKPPAPEPTTEGPPPTALPQPEPAVTAAASAGAAAGASPPEAPMNGRESEEGEPSGPTRPATFERTEAASSKARVPSPAPGGGAPPQPGANVAPGEERALGYTTVTRPEDAETQLRLEARQIQAACKKRGLPLHKLVRDVESHSSADLTRPGLSYALERLATGEFTCLVVTSLDRLTRSAASLGTLIYLLEERRTRLIVIDIGLDTRTDEGRLAARALVKVSGLERKKLEEHARKGLGAARDKRRSSGRPAVADRPSLKRRIAEMRTGGMTLQAIADTLNEEGVPTLRGGARWRPSSVQAAAGYKRPSRKAGPEPRNGPGDGSPP